MQKIHIQINDDTNLFFTSDLHFGHRNIIRFCNRPYTNEKEMNAALIDNWNNTVSNNDIVFVLGDTFWFNDSHLIKKTLSKLNGKEIHIIMGNHDTFESYHRVEDPRIHIYPEDIIRVWVLKPNTKGQEIVLSHYPLMTWSHREYSPNLFGHIHTLKGEDNRQIDGDLPLWENQYDVGCDYNDYKPISYDEIFKIIPFGSTKCNYKKI